jgi:hypothetical protein
MSANLFLKAALTYAARGWYVFPLRPRDKTPITRRGVKDATTDAAQIREWWKETPSANVAIATGRSGLVVIDVDGLTGETSLAKWQEENAPFPFTVTAYTGTRGRHFIFKAPNDGSPPIAPGVGIFGKGSHVDIRAGESYIAAPPSVHPNGKAYEWDKEAHPARVDVADFPNALLSNLRVTNDVHRPAVDSAPEIITDGQDEYGARQAAVLARKGFSKPEARAALKAMIVTRFAGGLDGLDAGHPWKAADVERWLKGAYEKFYDPDASDAQEDETEAIVSLLPNTFKPEYFYKEPAMNLSVDERNVAEPEPVDDWHVIDLAPYVAGTIKDSPPTMLERADGLNLLYTGKLHWISGEPEGLKSWLAQIAVADAIMDGLTSVYIDFEDAPQAVVQRLRSLGATDERILTNLRYYRPDSPMSKKNIAYVIDAAREHSPAISVMDGVNAAMGASGYNPDKTTEFYEWWAALGAPLRKETQGPIAAIDHVVKNPEARGQYAAGTAQKLAAVDVHFGIVVTSPFGIGLTGRANIILFKDRPGQLRAHGGKWAPGKGSPIGRLVMQSDPITHMIRFQIEAPDKDDVSVSGARPTNLMERVSLFFGTAPNGAALSKNAIEKASLGGAKGIRWAVDTLAAEGYLAVQPGPRGFPVYIRLKTYAESMDPKASQTVTVKLRTAGHESEPEERLEDLIV